MKHRNWVQTYLGPIAAVLWVLVFVVWGYACWRATNCKAPEASPVVRADQPWCR